METENINNICRICLSSDPFIALNVKHKKLKLDYYFLLNSCASLQAEENDCLPSKVCKKCQKSLVNCFQFRKIIIEGDKKLKDLIKSKKLVKMEKLSIKNEGTGNINEDNTKSKVETDKKSPCNDNMDNFEDIIDEGPIECILDEKSNETKTQDKKIQCQVCGKPVLKKKMKAHMRIHTGEKPYQCELCPQRFRRLDYLNVHKNIHTGERKFECETCHKKFGSYANLYNHNRTHTDDKPYMCSFCGKSFATSGTLQAHTRTHTGETPFKCEICGRGFMQSSDMRSHIRFFHERERNHECSVCKKKFARNTDIKKHMLIHTGERPFQCDFCNKSFNNKSNHTRHLQKMHLNL